MCISNKRAFSPVVASIILVAVAVAVSIAVVGWFTAFTFSFAKEEALYFVNDEWGPNCAYVDLTLQNGGTSIIVLDSLKVNSRVTGYTFVSGSESIATSGSCIVRVTYGFVVANRYSFVFSTSSGYNFVFYSEAKLP